MKRSGEECERKGFKKVETTEGKWRREFMKQAKVPVHATSRCCTCIWTPYVSYLSVSSLSRCTWHISEMLQRPVCSNSLHFALPLVAEAKPPPCENYVRRCTCTQNAQTNTEKRNSLTVGVTRTHFEWKLVASCQCLVQVLQGAQSGYLH